MIPQACTNTIMAHFVGMLFSNWLLTVVNKFKCVAGLGGGLGRPEGTAGARRLACMGHML